MRTHVDLEQRNFYAAWFKELGRPRQGYGVFGVIYKGSVPKPRPLCARNS